MNDPELDVEHFARWAIKTGRTLSTKELMDAATKWRDPPWVTDGPPAPRDRDEIATSAARKIINTPAMTLEYARAIILDGLNEAADIERYCADVSAEVFGSI